MSQTELKISQFLDQLGNQLSNGWETVSKIDQLSMYRDGCEEERDFALLELKSQIAAIDISLRMCLESLGLSHTLDRFAAQFKEFEGKTTTLRLIPFIGDLNSEVLGLLWTYHSALSGLAGNSISQQIDDQKRLQFERILINTPKIVKDRKIAPSSEKDVRQCIYDLMIHIFPDTVREIPIAQVCKTYKPDIGVQSLKAAAEYKFCDSEQEVKEAVGGLYEDMRGYDGSEDWKYFYAVVYMTDSFFTPEQIMAEFKHTRTDDNWKPILVFGKGGRKGPTDKKTAPSPKRNASPKKAISKQS